MVRMIEADELMKSIEDNSYPVLQKNGSVEKGMTITGIKQCIEEQPTVDAEPVRHGSWIDVSERLPNANEEYLEYFPVIVKGIIDGGTHDGEEIICKGFGKYIDWEREWEVETSIDTKIYPREVLAWFRTPEYEPKEDKYE